MTDLFEQSAAEYKSNVDSFEQSAQEYNANRDPFEQSAIEFNKKSPDISLEVDPNVFRAATTVNPKYFEGVIPLLTSMVSQPIAGLAAMSELINNPGEDVDLYDIMQNPPQSEDRLTKAGEILKQVGGDLTYEPRTEEGKLAAEMISKPFEKWHELSGKWGDVGQTQWTPILQSLIEASPMALPLIKKAAGKIMPNMRMVKSPTAMAATPESQFLRSEFESQILGKKTAGQQTKQGAGITDLGKYERIPTNIRRDVMEFKETPRPDIVKTPKKAANTDAVIRKAYEDVKQVHGVSTVPIADIIKETGLSKEQVHDFIRSNDEVRLAGVIEDVGTAIPKEVADAAYNGSTMMKIGEPLKSVSEIKKTIEEKHGSGTFKKKDENNILYSGIPPKEFKNIGNLWTKYVGEPVWDKFVMKRVPEVLGKLPGGKAVNRALIYDYRGNLPKTKEYISSMEEMRRNQAIGREYALDLGNRLQAFPEESQLKIGEYIKGENIEKRAGVGEFKKHDLKPEGLKVADEAVNTFLELGKQAVDVELMKQEAFFKHAGQYMPRLYTKYEYQSLLNELGLKKPDRLDLSRFKSRKDIPKEIRKEMGEILTPGYPVAKGITQLTHDIELAKYFSGIAKNPKWAIPKTAYRPKSPWAPVTEIPEGFKYLGENKKLGALNEAYVHPEIFEDLQQSIRVMKTPERVWRKSLGYWKFGKVIISPKTHVRNLMSNSVLAHLGGLPMYEQPIFLTKGAKALLNKNEYWRIGKQENLLRTTFTNAELKTLFDQVESNMKGVKGGSIVDGLGKVGQGWDKVKSGMARTAKLYEAEEQWFKMAKMIHNIERRGMTPKAAAADAEKWLFNYEKVTKFQDKFRRKWYGAPFATFTFKALPRVAEAAIKTPWRFALPTAMIYGLEKAAMDVVGDTKKQFEAKKEMRPEWMKGNFLGTIPNFARFPFVDDYGREHYLNLTYILPWGDIAEGGDFMGIPGSVRPMSMPVVNEAFQQIANRDIFWKSDIVPEEELAGKTPTQKVMTEAKLRGKHIAKTFLPTPVIDIEKAISSLKGEPDSRGRFRNPKIVAADILAGIKIYPVDYADELQKYVAKMAPDKGEIASKIRSQIKSLSIKKSALEKAGKSTKYFDEQIKKKTEQLLGMAKELKEKGKLYRETK